MTQAAKVGSLTVAEWKGLTPAERTAWLGQDAGHTAQFLYEAACQGLVEAQTALGQILLDGRGTPADAGAARRWFALAAKAGYAPAANMLGRCLERAWGGAPDYAGAAQLYRQAAEAGLDWGQYNLANMLLRGRGVTKDMPQSFGWFAAAAAQGHAKSINLVARFLEEGWIGPPDLPQAAAWYRRAAEGGDFRGQYNLASLLAQSGRVAEAVPWFERAGKTGSRDFQRLAAEQLLAHTDPALHAVGLAIAARCCMGGTGADYHRYGAALAAAKPRQAQAWLRLALAAGYDAAADLARLDAGSDGARRRGMLRRLLRCCSSAVRSWARSPSRRTTQRSKWVAR
jgi:TPR repeat protein